MITVLRLGHRPARDKRVTTHAALTARAFGADRILVSTRDPILEQSVMAVVTRFGGAFTIETGVPWRKTLARWPGPSVHLTMYGLPIEDLLPSIPAENLLVVIGAEKVPREVFTMVDWNVAVGNQPHSEVAALAVFLDRMLVGRGVRTQFQGRVQVLPQRAGKRLIERSE